MRFDSSFTRQQCFVGLKTKTIENVFQSLSYLYRLHVNYKNYKVLSVYWPGMLITAFLVVFVNQCKRIICMENFLKTQRRNFSVYCTLLSYKCPPSFFQQANKPFLFTTPYKLFPFNLTRQTLCFV